MQSGKVGKSLQTDEDSQLHSLFDELDSDHSGMIEREELQVWRLLSNNLAQEGQGNWPVKGKRSAIPVEELWPDQKQH